MERKRVTLSIPEDALALIAKYSTERTKADFVAQAIRAFDAHQSPTAGILERIEAKVNTLLARA